MKINRTIYRFFVWGVLLTLTLSCKKNPTKVAPTITTTEVTNIDFFSASSGGNLLSDGGSPVTASGICWSTDQYPSIYDYVINSPAVGNKGAFKIDLTGLKNNTTYYIRAFATNSEGTSYGNTLSFATLFFGMTDIEGNVYHAVIIGSQTWTVENLKTTKYRNGDLIANVTDDTQWHNLTTGAYAWYANNSSNKSLYGALYNWYAVTDPRHITPLGWHVPTDDEWVTLITYLGGENLAVLKLSEAGTVHWTILSPSVTNETGFTAIPGGYRYDYGNFVGIGSFACWWTATEIYSSSAYSRSFTQNRGYIWQNPSYKIGGYSLRCVKD